MKPAIELGKRMMARLILTSSKLPLVLIGVLMFGCGASTIRQQPLVAVDRRPEGRALPMDPFEEDLPEGIPTEPPEDWVEALEEGSCVPGPGNAGADAPCPSWSGVVVSEARAVRDGMVRTRYRELRQVYQSDRQVWSAQRELYESQLVRDREEILRLRPSWWERNDLEVGIALGVIAGAAMTIAIVYAVEGVTGP